MAKKVGTIVLGKIVVDEVCNKFKENLEEQIIKTQNAIQDLSKMLTKSAISLAEIDVDE